MTMYKNFEFDSQGAKLTGYQWAVSDPHAVVYLVHGIGEHAGRYDRVAKYFNNSGIALVSMDLRGHGKSPGKRGHIGDRELVIKDIDNLNKLIRNKFAGVPLIHYGHSLGGNISLDYRLRGEFSALPKGYLITSPWIRLVRPIPKALYFMVKTGAKIVPEATISQNIQNKMLGNVRLIEAEEDMDLRHQRISLKTAVQGFNTGEDLMENRVVGMHGGERVPMLLMHGTGDTICDINGSRAIARNYGNTCEYVEWEDYLHEIHNGTNDKAAEPVMEKMVSWILQTVK